MEPKRPITLRTPPEFLWETNLPRHRTCVWRLNHSGNRNAKSGLSICAAARNFGHALRPISRLQLLTLSPDGKMLASAAGYAESDIRLWNIATGQQIGQFQGHGSWVSSMVFSADGMKLTSGSADQTIRIWDVASRKCLDVLRGHRQEVWRLAMLPDGKTLVSGGKDGTVCFWDTSITHSKQPRISLPENVRAWCFEPNSRSVLTLSSQGRVSRWTGTDFQRQDPLLEMGTTQNDRWSSLFSKDGTLLACGSDKRHRACLGCAATGSGAPVDGGERRGVPQSFLCRRK